MSEKWRMFLRGMRGWPSGLRAMGMAGWFDREGNVVRREGVKKFNKTEEKMGGGVSERQGGEAEKNGRSEIGGCARRIDQGPQKPIRMQLWGRRAGRLKSWQEMALRGGKKIRFKQPRSIRLCGMDSYDKSEKGAPSVTVFDEVALKPGKVFPGSEVAYVADNGSYRMEVGYKKPGFWGRLWNRILGRKSIAEIAAEEQRELAALSGASHAMDGLNYGTMFTATEMANRAREKRFRPKINTEKFFNAIEEGRTVVEQAEARRAAEVIRSLEESAANRGDLERVLVLEEIRRYLEGTKCAADTMAMLGNAEILGREKCVEEAG